MVCIRNIDSILKISDFNEKEQTINDSSEEIQYKRPKNNKLILNVNFNDARTYLDDLKKADLLYIKMKANIKSEYNTKIHLNPVISSILHQYRELYLKNNGKLSTEVSMAEEQLAYIFNFYKKLVKLLKIYENLKSGKKTMKDYILETKD
ncbi:hypothetical protein QTP88_011511 [Uroleucon formosanum]